MNNNNENEDLPMNEEELQKMLNNITNEFNSKGLKVSAKVIRIDDLKNKKDIDTGGKTSENNPTKEEFKNVFKEVLRDFEEYMKDNPIPGPLSGDEESNCMCPVCFNSDTFEQKLGNKNGKFEYNSIKLNNRTFNIKYWTDGKIEYVMMNPETLLSEDLGLTEEERLKRDLEKAIEVEDYEEAGKIAGKIEEFKQSLLTKTN